MNEYLETLNNKFENKHELKEELRLYASQYDVPIIKRDSLVLITSFLKQRNPQRILEIGTAIGYSSICFASELDTIVDTIERDPKMIELAKENIRKADLQDKINIIEGDALEIDDSLLGEYDMIFIDAAKAQYIKFFDKYSKHLKNNGVIFTDNILFHGLVENNDNLSKNLRSLVKKINEYNNYLSNLEEYQTYYLEIGDGLAISYKKS